MKIKLEPYICYLAGLQSSSSEERNSIGIFTSNEELEEKFIDIALKKLKIKPNKILIEEKGRIHHVYFYHSKLGGQLRSISDKCNILFKLPTEQSRSYLAGMFDSSGRVSENTVYINHLTVPEIVMLQNLGVQTSGSKRIRNITFFLELVKGYSIMAEGILP